MTTIELRGDFETADPRLDRLPEKDERSRGYQARMVLDGEVKPLGAEVAPPWKRIGWWPIVGGEDQLNQGACTWFSKIHRLNASPTRRKPRLTATDAFREYHLTQHKDIWAGCRLGTRCPIAPSRYAYEGTSSIAAARHGKDIGLIDSYWWIGAGSGDVGKDMVDTLHRWSGINFGIGWTRSMFYPRPSGLLEVTGDFIGGHAIYGFEHAYRGVLKGEGKKIDVVWLQQSWGPDHGVTRRGVPGCVAIRTEDLVNKLLLAPGYWAGEGCVVVSTNRKIERPPLTPEEIEAIRQYHNGTLAG